ncbi:MAG: MbnP family protein [Saprospiraceae bacterium]
MKKLLLSCLTALSWLSVAQAQSNLKLHISPRLGNQAFALNTVISAGTYDYKITRLEYYVCQIKITHDGEQITPLTDLHLLVRPAVDSIYDLGPFPDIQNVEAITFSIGVDQAHNHLDPSSYPPDHPLAPQDPAMHWGWAAGYRFVAIEGLVGPGFANIFQVHSLGDANLKPVIISTAAEANPNGDKTIHIVADYAKVIDGIDVSGGLIVHASTGVAVTVLNNMRNLVFSAATSRVIDPLFEGAFVVSPNPAGAGEAIVSMTLPVGLAYRITLQDMTGRLVADHVVPDALRSFTIGEGLHAGMYLVHLWQNGRPVAVEKLVVTQ